ncbi:hypothetical protein HER10_EVM0004627 [Colletotrichum scovillei]|uniref:DNA mismatch repair protein HSM3 N-terminal domain-containing protein n=1 Tax=Colletotrichum scovillei TaxID=1209932 RepID=A0A9P7RG71_9PEZI|nr:uncharacterized protein HER10_EVM0004627 [Colletotrichum scovillei]KAF4773792.1 hypothetical protein HER10_EVM0004627 [Colletotrichum scovillei]KAG7056098.1 hypothetical protein JMJ77_0008549 [Colletotrichum scovillei]KAG7075541.1 hypothetical protein JMJ76_0012001 [Colletotrichum scovillei]KAG7082591.1 hypothetical protein JMJ78_0004692 [Colletotrichum scovillei]
MTERIVPNMSANSIPISGLAELEKHLDDLVASPDTPLDPKLLDDVELQLNETNTPPLLPRLLPPLTTILKTTPHDPKQIVSLTIKLLAPVPFTKTLQLADESSLLAALRSPSPHANLLALAILAKASASPSDAAILSLMPRVVEELLRRWLSAPQVEVGERAGRVLGDLLDVDCELPPPSHLPSLTASEVVKRRAPGQGRMWRRIIHDKELFGLVLSLAKGTDPSPSPEGEQVTLTERQLSLAQGRILRILPRLAALNIVEVGVSQFPDLTGSSETGLLQLAALHMVDKSDTLMHLNLIDFFETLLSVMRVVEHSHRTMGILKDLVRQATKDDDLLKNALRSLPDRTVPEESEALRTFIRDVLA